MLQLYNWYQLPEANQYHLDQKVACARVSDRHAGVCEARIIRWLCCGKHDLGVQALVEGYNAEEGHLSVLGTARASGQQLLTGSTGSVYKRRLCLQAPKQCT